jgi:hypothetical protein
MNPSPLSASSMPKKGCNAFLFLCKAVIYAGGMLFSQTIYQN